MLTGLILAGGPNRRMNGDPKALLSFHGETLIEQQIKAMRECCQEVIVVTRDPAPLLRLLDKDVRIITDYFAGKGPIAGLHAGFTLAKHDHIWAVGCDMPFISSGAAELLLECMDAAYEAAIPLVGGNLYPLHGVYGKVCADRMAALLEDGEFRLTALLEVLNGIHIPQSVFTDHGIDLRFIENIDTGEDYRRAIERDKNDITASMHRS